MVIIVIQSCSCQRQQEITCGFTIPLLPYIEFAQVHLDRSLAGLMWQDSSYYDKRALGVAGFGDSGASGQVRSAFFLFITERLETGLHIVACPTL